MDRKRQDDLGLLIPEKVCIVGAGGTGVWTSILLAQVGVKELIIFDDDTIEEHNRNRLPFRKEDVGKKKVVILKNLITTTYEECVVFAFDIKFSADFVIEKPEYVIDCTDDFKSQMNIVKWAKENSVYYIRAGSKENHITVTDFVTGWDSDYEEEDGKCGVTISQWIVPQVIVASSVVRWICLGKKIKIEEI
ncbi:MAG: ThiF family adenylyltransferase [Nanoarchaeota archaeon]|nr:ThiF family adenylyltransferase [Nanoarchaeota archaeon]